MRPGSVTWFLLGYLAFAFWALSNGDLHLLAPEKLDLVFNDMARRLLAGDFTSDPAAIQFEAFIRDGQTYTYFGIFPALLRMPMVLLGQDWHVARVSCLVALGITVFCYLRLMQLVLVSRPGAWGAFAWPAMLSVTATGPQVYLLASASVYQEVIFWSAALTAGFALVAIRPWLAGRMPGWLDQAGLAALAGCILICRVSDGAGLYLSMGLLLSLLVWLRRGRGLREALPAVVILAGFIGVLMVVNEGRWGDPFVVAPLELYNQIANDPSGLERLRVHGAFSLVRLVMAAAYYGAGLKLEQLVPALFQSYYGGIEGPRTIVPLAAPTLFVWAVAGCVALPAMLARRRLIPLMVVAGIALGPALSLAFLAIALRYTFDGWTLLVFLAAFGARYLACKPPSRIVLGCSVTLLLVGIVFSQAMLLRYKIVYSGTDPAVRLGLSQLIQPVLCPKAVLNPAVALSDFNPLVTASCPPLW